MKKKIVTGLLLLLPLFAFAEERAEERIERIPDWGAFLINLGVGCGVGSFIQGDILGGAVALTGEVGGVALLCAGYFSMIDFASRGDVELTRAGVGMVAAGAALLVGARIFTCIRPWKFQSRKDLSLQIAPSSDRRGAPGLAVACSF